MGLLFNLEQGLRRASYCIFVLSMLLTPASGENVFFDFLSQQMKRNSKKFAFPLPILGAQNKVLKNRFFNFCLAIVCFSKRKIYENFLQNFFIFKVSVIFGIFLKN